MKITKVVPVFKNEGSNLFCNNFRPISLLSNMNKVYEKLMYSRLYAFLIIHNCLCNLQFGFREKHPSLLKDGTIQEQAEQPKNKPNNPEQAGTTQNKQGKDVVGSLDTKSGTNKLRETYAGYANRQHGQGSAPHVADDLFEKIHDQVLVGIYNLTISKKLLPI